MKDTSKKRFLPSIRLQLLVSMLGIVALCMSLVWVTVSFRLQDTYDRHIQEQLTGKAQTIVDILNQYEGKVSSRDYFSLRINEDFINAVNAAIQGDQLDISQECVDIFDSTMRDITYAENLFPCSIHGGSSGIGIRQESSRHTTTAIRLHQQLAQKGTLLTILETPNGDRQMVVGLLSADGSYGVMVSSALTRVDEASLVMKQLLTRLAVLLCIIALVLALLFSLWFTRPIRQLSIAARQMAGGDYRTRVNSRRKDELGTLAREFNHMADEVQRSAQLQRDLLANVSHDLRTPLTLIKGYAETVRDLTGDNPQRRTDQLNIIVDETDRLSALVNSVMDLSKVSSGTEKPVPVTFDMAQLCAEVADRYEAICRQNGWTLHLEANTPCQTTADPAMMERALHNLLGNAAHHLGEDQAFFLRCIPLEGGCRVEVEDHGPGIDAQDLPYIFDRYYRSRSDAGKVGTGLGLTITKAILQGHGFRFGVNSTLGKGTTFWFETLPTK